MSSPFKRTHPGADPELAQRDWERDTYKSKPTEDVVRLTEKPSKMRLYQSESHRMKQICLHGATVHTPQPPAVSPNPIWQTFESRCVVPIRSAEEMRKKLQYYTSSDDVMVVRYHQANCTACNAIDKTYEVICHEQKAKLPNLHFYEVSKEDNPELTKGLVRYPQVKAFSGGAWTDLEFKPNETFRSDLFYSIEKEVALQEKLGNPISALQAEEMYFSSAGPAMKQVLEGSIVEFYCRSRTRLHNYWKQVSLRRSWFYTKFIKPNVDEEVTDEWRAASVFGERVEATAEPLPTDF